MTAITSIWTKKLAAWLHDPGEKALVLMRDVDNQGQRIGHEDGSVAQLREKLGIRKADFDKRADHYAAAADRPLWPCEDGKPRPAWANVHFLKTPVLIHPLSGEKISLGKLTEIAAPHIRNVSFDHFLRLVETDLGGAPDHHWTQLAFWRFGPEPKLAAPEIGELWRMLPADTRVPDHTIWAHLDIVSALAGAMHGAEPDNGLALLSVSFGPVQGFIAQARSTSDLWAGSHLLSSLAWEGLKVVCEELGPDAVLFPHLRGSAAVDRWLLETVPAHRREAWQQRFEDIEAEWLKSATDSNPLFAATLPNKFMAVVPANRAQALADNVTASVRGKALEWANQAAERVFEKADGKGVAAGYWRDQVQEQLRGFPEVHWSVAEWPLDADEQGFPIADSLQQALATFYPETDAAPGFFADPLWELVSNADVVEHQGKRRKFRKLKLSSGEEFFVPNPGLLYPAVHELAERGLAAVKSLRTFSALPQHGHRCTLCGEREWLAGDATQLSIPAGQRKDTAWDTKAQRLGIKNGEYLCGVCAMKRLWPTLYVEQVRSFLEGEASRFVVSTHTMALATSIGQLANSAGALSDVQREALAVLNGWVQKTPRVAMPASLNRALSRCGDVMIDFVGRRLPRLIDELRDNPEEAIGSCEQRIASLLGDKPETYYALIQMDGDRMGAWMAGNEKEYQCTFEDTWHPQVQAAVKQKFGSEPDVLSYLESFRPASPARHAAISKVLNDFSTHVARHVLENVFKGKLIYAGGDDVLAMVSVDDLLPAMLLLRAAYSGVGSWEGLPGDIDLKGLQLGKGFVHLNGRLMLMMGIDATASIGAIVAHHQAPLTSVLRQLRLAELAAKAHGRNAFCLRVMKRGGGEVGASCHFWDRPDQPPPLADTALGLMLRFAETLAQPDMSRRAVYRATEWLAGLPARGSMGDKAWRDMVATNLAFQLKKQSSSAETKQRAESYALPFVELACRESKPTDTARFLDNLLVTAEFFAREGRIFAMGA